MKKHYVYYSFEEWGRGYIGSRSCDCLPEEDTDYFGSFTDPGFNPTRKIILRSDYETRKEANKDEVALHDFFDVAKNPHFANKAKQTSEKFSTQGVPHSLEARGKIRASHMGMRMSEGTKKKIGISNTGKPRSEETRQKIRKALLGENSPKYGTTTSQETKKKLSEALSNRLPWTNSSGKTVRQTECPGEGWFLGLSEETKLKMSESRSGEKNPNYGKPVSEETRQKISESLLSEKNSTRWTKWWVNRDEKTLRQKDYPGEGWIQGRKFKGEN
jgi:hypothetical protein